MRRLLEILLVAGRLGLTSFGGPVAHLGYFREEYVVRRRWLADEDYTGLVSLAQLLPGPASSQVGIAIGMLRGGLGGGLVAWLAFTLPSAAALVALALLGGELGREGWVHGLQLVAVAVVAQAVWGMGRSVATDPRRIALVVAGALVAGLWGSPLAQLAVLAGGAVVGLLVLRPAAAGAGALDLGVSRRLAVLALALFAALLVALPVVRGATGSQAAAMADAYYRTGSLVFGGGHVVLPLLERQVVEPGWVSESDFLAGYGAAQAVPGPLFTFAGYLGAVQEPEPDAIGGAALALAAIFLPSFLLVVGVGPFWAALRRRPRPLAALAGVNAVVVGLLLAALVDPVFTTAVDGIGDLAIALAAFGALMLLRAPPWTVVAACALLGWAVL